MIMTVMTDMRVLVFACSYCVFCAHAHDNEMMIRLYESEGLG